MYDSFVAAPSFGTNCARRRGGSWFRADDSPFLVALSSYSAPFNILCFAFPIECSSSDLSIVTLSPTIPDW